LFELLRFVSVAYNKKDTSTNSTHNTIVSYFYNLKNLLFVGCFIRSLSSQTVVTYQFYKELAQHFLDKKEIVFSHVDCFMTIFSFPLVNAFRLNFLLKHQKVNWDFSYRI
jgi:hypothetical protein